MITIHTTREQARRRFGSAGRFTGNAFRRSRVRVQHRGDPEQSDNDHDWLLNAYNTVVFRQPSKNSPRGLGWRSELIKRLSVHVAVFCVATIAGASALRSGATKGWTPGPDPPPTIWTGEKKTSVFVLRLPFIQYYNCQVGLAAFARTLRAKF